MNINIIIIGGKKNINNDKDYKRWNNDKQANYYDIVYLINNIKTIGYKEIKTYCIDPLYIESVSRDCNDISYIKSAYILGDTSYCDINSHNIFVDFSNMLDEFFVTKDTDYNKQAENIMKYNEYKITWLSCGCGWFHFFPMKLLMHVIENNIYTPTDYKCKSSYLKTIEFNKKHNNILFKPYCQGVYEILGSFIWRGMNNSNEYEEIIHELLEDFKNNFDYETQKELEKIENKSIRWNMLNRTVRVQVNKYIYGTLITLF